MRQHPQWEYGAGLSLFYAYQNADNKQSKRQYGPVEYNKSVSNLARNIKLIAFSGRVFHEY